MVNKHFKRRSLLLTAPTAGLLVGSGCSKKTSTGLATRGAAGGPASAGSVPAALGSRNPIIETFPLGSPPWKTFDPFLFCVHHRDDYPVGNARLGPTASLAGRNIGSDFAGKDGWSMYHGDHVPGFPRHPHRGFETVTMTRRGYVDHSDSLGATARYGEGDVQWMTAGDGIVHAEMFPLLNSEKENPTELFQIWLNLPSVDKFAKPHFSMFWSESVPRHAFTDERGLTTEVTTTAGALANKAVPSPPPNSWASRPTSEVAIWTITMAPGATWDVPAAAASLNRTLYFFRGGKLSVSGVGVESGIGLRLHSEARVRLTNGDKESELLMLQGRPIAEPIARRGPFVMNTSQEIAQAFQDYRRTQYGGWPWPNDDPVHQRGTGRFAIHADGRKETAT